MARTTAKLLLLACILGFSGAAIAQSRMAAPKILSAAAWDMLRTTTGIESGGRAGLDPSVQIVCDVHCPYCARLYMKLVKERPELRVRWVLIAYFKPDSDRIAAAILASPDPVASLHQNYSAYDHASRLGGYQADPRKSGGLDAAHGALKSQWSAWGGFTPMVLVRTTDGAVLQAAGSAQAFLDPVLDRAAAPTKVYEAW